MATKAFTQTNIVSPNFPETNVLLNEVTSEFTPVEYVTGAYGFVDAATAESISVQSNLHATAIENLINTVNALLTVIEARRVAIDA